VRSLIFVLPLDLIYRSPFRTILFARRTSALLQRLSLDSLCILHPMTAMTTVGRVYEIAQIVVAIVITNTDEIYTVNDLINGLREGGRVE